MKIRLTLESKVIILALSATLFPVLIVSGLILWKTAETRFKVDSEVDYMLNLSADKICQGVYDLCETMDVLLQSQVNQSLEAAHVIVKKAGIPSLGKEDKLLVDWSAMNQFSKEVSYISLPKLMIGDRWLDHNHDVNVKTPIIDDIIEVAGGTATIFQKMNDKGDMLRVATNVESLQGTRAIGTYIPAIHPDGDVDPVVSYVLMGGTYRGRAYVVNDWYLTAYEPLRDENDTIVGMLYVGIRQKDIEALRKKIINTQVGTDGYVYVLGGSGEQKGRYIISKGGLSDGKDIFDSKDDDGTYFIRDIIKESKNLTKGEVFFKSYPWKNADDILPRMKMAACRYYEPWDWVISASIYKDDFTQASENVESSLKNILYWSLGGGALVGILACSIAALMGTRFTRSISRVTTVANFISAGNLSAAIKGIEAISEDMPLKNRSHVDESVMLLMSIDSMTKNLNSLIGKVQHSGIQIASSSTRITANVKQLEETVVDQATSTNEVLATTTEITGISKELVKVMNGVSGSASVTAELAGSSRSDLNKMGKAMEQLAASTNTVFSRLAVIDEKTENVNSVVTTIFKVASQTNLLSLNASIEAEKAGEYGRGFSVVAREIQRLADQTAVATTDIDRIVNEVNQSVQAAISEMESFSEKVNDLVIHVEENNVRQSDIIKRVQGLTPAFEEVHLGVNSQADGAEQIRDAIVRLSDGAEQISGSLNDFMQTSSTLNNSAKGLQDEISRFKISD